MRLRRPTETEIAAFAQRQSAVSYSYPEVGATQGELPPGYDIARAEFELGRGDADFRRAVEAMRGWKLYDDPAGHIRLCTPKPAFGDGATLVLVGRHLGLWSLSACRVVYLIADARRFGFAYGTLEHVVRGEERFEIHWDDDDRVMFRLTAFSTPTQLLARLSGPVGRYFQREGGRSYARGLSQAIAAGGLPL